jgi:site-specific recombinase XerD
MTELTDLTADQTTALIPTWQLALRAEDKSPATINVYTQGVRTYLTWCTKRGAAPMTRASLSTWITEMLDAGAAPGTVRTRQQAVRRFTAWLISVGRLSADPFLGIKGPPQRHPLITPLTDDELRALITTCTAPTHRPDEPLHHRRDEAIIRLMLETGIRAGELIALGADDVDLVAGLVTIRRGKGGRGRVIAIGPAVTRALHAYLDLRQHHRHADATQLWLGERGTSFGYDGLGRALRRRAKRAGIKGFHPHKLRHTAAHRWLAHGGSESGLMAIAGWTRTDMLVRYTRAGASERAAQEARRLNLGEL